MFLKTEMDDSMDMADGYGSMDLDKQPTGGSHVPGAGLHNGDVPSMPSIETLLLNIQGLIKVATDTLRHQERQTSQDKGKGCFIRLACCILGRASQCLPHAALT